MKHGITVQDFVCKKVFFDVVVVLKNVLEKQPLLHGCW
jgi:hypothetical protein